MKKRERNTGPIVLDPIRIPWWHQLGSVLFTIAFACAMLIDNTGGTVALAPPAPPFWMTIGGDGAPRFIDSRNDSLESDTTGTYAVSAQMAYAEFGWPRVMTRTMTTRLVMEPLPGARPISMTPEIRTAALNAWDGLFDAEQFAALKTGLYVHRRLDAVAVVANGVLWGSMLLGAYWTVRFLPKALTHRARAVGRSRLKDGQCPACRYSLEGLEKPWNHCPECGCRW